MNIVREVFKKVKLVVQKLRKVEVRRIHSHPANIYDEITVGHKIRGTVQITTYRL